MTNKIYTKLARDLNGEEYQLVTDSQDVETIADYAGIPPEYREDITGAIVVVGEGEYEQIWLTESGAPWDLGAFYHTPDYYKD